MDQEIRKAEIEDIEIYLLLEGINRLYGYDFREYSRSSLKRRIKKCMEQEGLHTISAYLNKILHNPAILERFLYTMTVNVTDLFRDPDFFLLFRTEIVPILRTYPVVRIWIAGCSTGEEIYSMAIILEEEGILERALIYATDINEKILRQAKSGIFPLSKMQDYTMNYQQSGGKRDFSDYYTADYENIIFNRSLQKKMVFSQHNLVCDHSFNEFNVIFCRNVMIYFNKKLQQRVYSLLHKSLYHCGFLGIGKKETLTASLHKSCYRELKKQTRLYKKIKS